ncbi:hypothetical protein J3E73DRAFT_252334 [Bipolaris maydis]|nr:hypothetical protein J3E73DRAFT_252334 [Bipolaris maydis]
MCLGATSISLHQKLYHTLGGSFDLPHAEIHTIVFPHPVVYNSKAVPDAMAKLAKVLPDIGSDVPRGLNKLLEDLAVGHALKDLGMKEEDIEKAVATAMASPYANVREVDPTSLETLIRRAWAGEEARADL